MKFFLAAVLMLCRISMASAENLLIVGEDEIRQAIEKEFVEQGQNQALEAWHGLFPKDWPLADS